MDTANNFVEELQNLCNKYNINAKDLANRVNTEVEKSKDDQLKERALKNKKLVGKCFVEETKSKYDNGIKLKRFLKVISYQSLNENRVECLVFEEYPTYTFKYQTHLLPQPGDYFLGFYNFISFEISSFFASDFKNMKEISLEEYNKALMGYAQKLASEEWTIKKK